MRSVPRRLLLICGVAALTSLLAGIGVALAGSARRTGPYARGAHGGLRAKTVTAKASTNAERVIVILRNQVKAIPATRSRTSARIKAESRASGTLLRQVSTAGGRITRRYHALNAFAATVSPSEQAALSRSADVAQVIPDTVVTLPTPPAAPGTAGGAGGSGSQGGNSQQLCPAPGAKPLLEPEALQTTHTAYNDPATPQAQNLASGRGVKVAFFADGLDINNPDFVRPDGSHVFIDYKDFSGDGLNAPTGAAEAFGDASSIAAQGRLHIRHLEVHEPDPPAAGELQHQRPRDLPRRLADRHEGVRQREQRLQLGDPPGARLRADERPPRRHQRVLRRVPDPGHDAGSDAPVQRAGRRRRRDRGRELRRLGRALQPELGELRTRR